MKLKILNISDVATGHMCCGCGACAYAAPDAIEMGDAVDFGRRPFVKENNPDALRQALDVCPGISLEHTFDPNAGGHISELAPAWGPVLELWEGYAADQEIRFAGSSGGAASALSLYCIEKAGMHGVLHIASRPDVPYLNHTVLSTTRRELLERTGSRYAPASPCDGLQRIEDAPAECVFIGKPCDVAATYKARKLRPDLDKKLGLTIGIFCAGTPSTRGTLEMIKRMGIDAPERVTSVRYRGMGWPGNAVVCATGGDKEQRKEMTYAESWGDILQKHRQWRCYVCVDHTGEFADIAVGDPWYRPIPAGETGRSLIVVRTERGRRILREALAAGYIHAERVDAGMLEASQPGFPTVRGSVWGRILMCRLFGAPVPRYVRMPMFRFWVTRLSVKEKLQSLYGTVKRIVRKRLRKRSKLERFNPMVAPSCISEPEREPANQNCAVISNPR